jgi:putative inorganic carbon (hco3(-)) transporter
MKRESIFNTVTQSGIFLFGLSLPISHVPAQFGIGIAFLGWLGEGLVNRRWNAQWHPAFIPLILYLFWNIVSASLSERPGHSLSALLDNEWPLLIMLMLFWAVRDEVFLKRVVYVFLASGGVAVLYAVWQVFGGVELYRSLQLDPMGAGLYRAVGFYSFYLTFAALAMAVCLFSSSCAFEFKKWYFSVLAVFGFLAVIGSFARSIWLALAVSIPVFAMIRNRKAGTVLTGGLLVIVVIGMFAVPTLRHRLGSIVDLGQNETRLNLWKTAINIAEANPVFGVGEDNWDLVFERYRVPGFYDTTVHPHNDYLTVLVSSGVPGLIAFLSMWSVILVSGFKASTKMKSKVLRSLGWGGVFSVFGFLVGSMFQNYYGTFINCLEWWFVAGVLMASAKLNSLSETGQISP